MNVHPIQYGPSLRQIAEAYFPGAAASSHKQDGPTSFPLVSGKIAPEHEPRAWEMNNHVRSVTRAVTPSAAASGDIIWFRAFNPDGKNRVAPLSFGVERPFVLDEPCPRLGPDAWYAWLASPYTAYANNWDVFVPWDDASWPYDPEACVVHANRRTVVHIDFATSVTVRISPTCLAGLSAVSEEFKIAALSPDPDVVVAEVGDDGFRTSLGGLRVRTGQLLDSVNDPRLVFSQLMLTLCTELTQFAEAWAAATKAAQPAASLIETLTREARTRFASFVDVLLPVVSPPPLAKAATGAREHVFRLSEIDSVVVSIDVERAILRTVPNIRSQADRFRVTLYDPASLSLLKWPDSDMLGLSLSRRPQSQPLPPNLPNDILPVIVRTRQTK